MHNTQSYVVCRPTHLGYRRITKESIRSADPVHERREHLICMANYTDATWNRDMICPLLGRS